MFCVGCGEALDLGADRCAACGTDAVGASFAENVHLAPDQKLRVPPLCCCCLSPSDGLDDEKMSSQVYGGTATLQLPIPWCSFCRETRTRIRWVATIVGLASFPLAYALLGIWYESLANGTVTEWSTRVMIALGVATASFVLAPLPIGRVFAFARMPGHVPSCNAISGNVSRRSATISLANRAFARIWRDFQATGTSQAAALRAALPAISPAPQPTPAPTGAGAAAHRNLNAAAVRDLARQPATAPVNVGQRRRGLDMHTPETGADAAAGALRFVARECTFSPAGLRARGAGNRTTELAWADIVELRVRQLPAGPPFDGALLLDIVSGPTGTPPVRLLPTTRANYGVLPGSGVTSQHNFRRLVRHVLAQNPAARCEGEAMPFVNEDKPAPRLATVSELTAYDGQYGR